jgi:type IV pilus assembly protein PilM
VAFTKPKRAIGLDVGTYAVKAVQMSRSGNRLYVDEAGYAKVDRNLLNADPVAAQSNAIRQALQQMAAQKALVVAALPGQAVVIRYPRINNPTQATLSDLVQREAANSIPYDLNEVFLDWTVLEEMEEGDKRQAKVLLVAAKHEVIDSRVQIIDAAEFQCGVLGVDSLALADAAEGCEFLRDGETVAMVNIGLTSASIHFVKDGISNFIRDVSWGARELIQALTKERRMDYDDADKLLQQAVRGEVEAKKEEPSASKEAAESSPFDSGAPVSLLDPLDEDVSPQTSHRHVEREKTLDEIFKIPLARLVSEVRRSFDYYEHQLYERPVDRLLLSGGIAGLPMLKDTLQSELGVEALEVCDPANSALMLGDPTAMEPLSERSAQFMVAVGLAARGMAEL